MFGPRYFGHRYFGPRYFGDGSDTAPAVGARPGIVRRAVGVLFSLALLLGIV